MKTRFLINLLSIFGLLLFGASFFFPELNFIGGVGGPTLAMAAFTEIDIDEMVTEFGAKYRPEGQTAKSIKQQLFTPSETAALFRKIPNNDSNVYRGSYSTIEEVLQAFSVPFASKGALQFKPMEYELGEFKIDRLLQPDGFWKSWLGFFAELAEVDRSKWTFIQWIIQQKLLPKAAEDFEKEVAFWGWKVTGYDPTPTVDGATFVRQLTSENAVSKANASMDGIFVTIAKHVASGRITPITTGALETDPADFCTQIEEFVKNIEPNLRKKLDFLFMREDLVTRYRDGRRDKYNQNWNQESDLNKVKDVNLFVQSKASMESTDKIWATPAENRVRPTVTENPGRFDIQRVDRQVKLLNNWAYGICFDVPEFVVTNDIDNTISQDIINARYTEEASS